MVSKIEFCDHPKVKIDPIYIIRRIFLGKKWSQILRKKSLYPLGDKASEISKNDTKLRKKIEFDFERKNVFFEKIEVEWLQMA